MRQFSTIAVVLLSLFLLGMWGQYVLSPETFRHQLLQVAYNSMRLFVLEGDWLDGGPLPWQLDVTRFLAPLASVTGVLVYLTQGAWTRAANYFVRFRKGHIVVAGLGGRSWQFVQSCQNVYRLVIVEIDPENPHIDSVRRLGMSVITGDILNPQVMEQVNLANARHLVAFTGSDGINVELAIKARSFMAEHDAEQLLVHMHVDSTHIAERLENYPKFFADATAAQVMFFSIYALNARILFRDYPPECFAWYAGRRQVHIAIYHFGRQAEYVLLEAVRVCHFANESRLRFSVFDERALEKGEKFLASYPTLKQLCDMDFIQMPILETRSLESIHNELLTSVTEHVICFPTDADNLDLALLLRAMLLNRRNANAPILVHMERSSGLAQLLESNHGRPEIPDGIYPFGMLDEVLHHENILADGLDVMARAFHESFLERRDGLDVDRRLYSSLHDWVALPEPERSSNRQSADHLATKLRAVGCVMVDGVHVDFTFSDDEAILLARMEHNRWCSEKIAGGWQYGPVRVESAKLNPSIVPWDQLDKLEQSTQIDGIKRLPDLVGSKLGKGFVRQVRIGVTGHRLHKLDVMDGRLIREIEEAIGRIVEEHHGDRLVILSPLAEGADRMIAGIAMEKFGLAMHVPLPLPFELYQTDFSSQDSVDEFKELVGKAEVYFEMPMRFGNQEELSSRLDGTPNEVRNRQYALAGAFGVQCCDHLIAVYDGEPEAGTGGTGQVVRWRSSGEIEPEYRFDCDFFPPRSQHPPVVIAHGTVLDD